MLKGLALVQVLILDDTADTARPQNNGAIVGSWLVTIAEARRSDHGQLARSHRRLDTFMMPLSWIGWCVGPWLGAR
jgi:hypothetical protein